MSHSERKHARLAPSNGRWPVCPGEPRLTEGLPDTSSPAADEGTAAHEVAERWLRGEVMQVGEEIDVRGTKWEVTDEMQEAVLTYVEECRRIIELHAKAPGDD